MFRFLERAQDRALSALHPIKWWAALDRAVDKRGFLRTIVRYKLAVFANIPFSFRTGDCR